MLRSGGDPWFTCSFFAFVASLIALSQAVVLAFTSALTPHPDWSVFTVATIIICFLSISLVLHTAAAAVHIDQHHAYATGPPPPPQQRPVIPE